MGEEVEIKHTSSVIYARLPDGSKAFLGYSVEGNVMKLIETYTPPQHRGKGIAAKLVEYAIKLAREKGLLIEPVCSYAIYYFLKHKEYRDLLVPKLREADLSELYKKRLKEERKDTT